MTKTSSNQPGIVAGIDLGGTNTEIGLIDQDGRCLNKSVLRTKNYESPKIFTLAVAEGIKELTGSIHPQLQGIGIGAPNGNFYSGCIEHAPNLSWEGIVPIVEMLQGQISVPAALTNDANAAAVGEGQFGGAKGMKNFMSITIGTGLGSGIVVNGEVLYGHSGFAGEMGHTTAIPNGRPCTCGKRGCLEAYASARGLVKTTQELLEFRHDESLLRALPSDMLTAYRIHDAARNGDPIAIGAFEQLGEVLGRSIADAVAYFSPEAVFLFGGLSRAGNLILGPTQAAFDKYLLPIFKGSVRLELSSMNDDNAAILGAGALIWNKILQQ